MLTGAKFGCRNWGVGVAWAAADGGVGRSAPDPATMSEDDYRALSASDGIQSLQGDFAEVKPDIDGLEDAGFPGPIAEAFFWDDSAIVGIQGPVGSGKTTTLLKSRLRRAKMMPRSVRDGWRYYKLLIIRATYRQLWSTTIPDFLKVFPKDLGEWSGGRGGPVTFRMTFEDELGPIEFIAEMMAFGDDIVGSMRGYQTTDIWLHEMDTNPADVLANGITRIKRHPDQSHFRGYPDQLRDYGQIVGDMNAMDKDNYCYQLFHDPVRSRKILDGINSGLPDGATPVRIAFHRQPGFGEDGCENLQNLPSSYYQTQIAALQVQGKGDLVDRLVYNKITWLRIGDPVFRREFNRSIHVSADPLEVIAELPLVIGLDQGFMGAAVIGQFVHPWRWRIYRTLFFPGERLMAKEFGRRLREFLDDEFPGKSIEGGWGDMAGEHGSSLASDENETWNRLVGQTAGFSIWPQRIGTNRIQPRLEAVRAALETIRGGEPGLLIEDHPSNEPLISGFEARYIWADEIDASGEKRKVPNKRIAEANVLDALQYLLLSKSHGDGMSPESLPGVSPGNIGGLPGTAGGLQTDFDVLNPYGD